MAAGCAKFPVSDLFWSITIATGFVVSVAAPSQFRKIQPIAAEAVALTIVLLAYVPPGGSSVMEPLPFVKRLSVYVGRGLKLAVIVLLLFINTFSGFVVELSSPVHCTKNQPAPGVAVTVTTEPAG